MGDTLAEDCNELEGSRLKYMSKAVEIMFV